MPSRTNSRRRGESGELFIPVVTYNFASAVAALQYHVEFN